MSSLGPRTILFASTLAATACRTAPPTGPGTLPTTHSTEWNAPRGVHPDVEAVSWLVGRWTSPSGLVEETWTAAGDVLIGVSFEMAPETRTTRSFELMIIRRDKDGLVFAAMPGGAPETVFRAAELTESAVTFSNPAHDFPKHVRYARRNDGAGWRLDARIWDDAKGVDFPYLESKRAPAPELELIDLRWAGDVRARGVEAWVEAFAPGGGMINHTGRIEGADAIRRAAQLFLGPDRSLEWTPSASGLSPAGDAGFTVGPWRALSDGPGGRAPAGRGAYATLWTKTDQGWRVLFDVGDPEPAAPTPATTR
ncbi:nuclear transport factor 2 family protein [Myxococcota bacterium]|nr:nuclear transport factor 2 family protein [Myxococcota bacterium]